MNKKGNIGDKFNSLTIISEEEPLFKNGQNYKQWKCLCDCGNYRIATQTSIRTGKVKACVECSANNKGNKRADYSGKRFGRLVVNKMLFNNGNSYCECKCDCGNQTIVLATLLKQGNTKSCGCLQKERVRESNHKTNKYDLSHKDINLGIGFLNNGKEFYFDLEDYDKIKNICWFENDKNAGYIVGRLNDKKIYLSRLIMDVLNNDSVIVDHIHGSDTVKDNRKINLRIGTPSNNGMNKKIQPYNITGETGITYNKNRKKWLSFLWVNNEYKHLGYYISKEDAINARKDAEEKYFGEWSRKNSRENDNYIFPYYLIHNDIIINNNNDEEV